MKIEKMFSGYDDNDVNLFLNLLFNEKKMIELQNKLVDCLEKVLLYKHYEDEICEYLNISHEVFVSLINELQKRGRIIIRKYLENGRIKYSFGRSYELSKSGNFINDEVRINHLKNSDTIKMMVMSDLHFGSIYERLDLIDNAFSYCAKNGINIILNCGDFINGVQKKSVQKVLYVDKQVERFLEKYPYDKNIITLGVLGNHDIDAFKYGVNLADACYFNRPDVAISYNSSLNIKYQSENILLSHGDISNCNIENGLNKIIFCGHYHKYSLFSINNKLKIDVPSLSDMSKGRPSVLILEMDLNKGRIQNIEIKNIDMRDLKVLSHGTFLTRSRNK